MFKQYLHNRTNRATPMPWCVLTSPTLNTIFGGRCTTHFSTKCEPMTGGRLASRLDRKIWLAAASSQNDWRRQNMAAVF
jgi:hypothetical protein